MATELDLNQLKNEFTALQKKLAELSKEELTQVTGAAVPMDWAIPECSMQPLEDCDNCPEKATCARAK